MAIDEGAIEAVARALCKNEGRDPEELFMRIGGERRQWQFFCDEARRFITAHTALWEHMRVSARKKEMAKYSAMEKDDA